MAKTSEAFAIGTELTITPSHGAIAALPRRFAPVQILNLSNSALLPIIAPMNLLEPEESRNEDGILSRW